MALRVHNGMVAFERDDDLIYLPFASGSGGDLEQELLQMRGLFRVTSYCSDHHVDLSRMGPADQLCIWAHGNTRRNGIAGGDTVKLAGDVAQELSDKRLSRTAPVNILLWSCFGGVKGGFGESLWLSLKARGHQAVEVHAPLYASGTMTAFRPEDRYLRGLLVYHPAAARAPLSGDLIPGASRGRQWHGATSLATVADVRTISSRNGVRFAEV